jgi:hypothetical protein
MSLGNIYGFAEEYLWITHKEKLGWFVIFIVDAINIGHENYFMSFMEYFMGLRDACRIPRTLGPGRWITHKEKLGWFVIFIVVGHQSLTFGLCGVCGVVYV